MNIRTWLLLNLILIGSLSSLFASEPVIATGSRQLIVVITDSTSAANGILTRYERLSQDEIWLQTGDPVPAGIGSNGLAWGIGRHPLPETAKLKREGDQCSPAGIFELPAAFGFATQEEMGTLRVPYRRVTNGVVCIDDSYSAYYNMIVSRQKVDGIDWNSEEDMARYDPWYRLGVIIGHNDTPSVKGAGSCIFLHIRATETETTFGCTAIAGEKLSEIIYWLDEKKHPLLVQLTIADYTKYRSEWLLP